MREIWKYEVPVDDQIHEIDIPSTAVQLHVACQFPHTVAIWFEVDIDELKGGVQSRTRHFRVVGTGHPIADDEWQWRGTAPCSNGLVWHLLEKEF